MWLKPNRDKIFLTVSKTDCVKFVTKALFFCTGFQPGVFHKKSESALAINIQAF